MHKCTALFTVVPVVLLAGACGGHDSHSTRDNTARAATPSTTPAAANPALQRRPAYEQITSEVTRDFQQAHIPDDLADDGRLDAEDYCSISLGRLFPESGHAHAREDMVTLLRGEGWKPATTSGTDETHLARNGWDLFITRDANMAGSGGAAYQSLRVSVNCNKA
ncbi:hypothetical protein [Actinacidiphila acidipaludis]|uniref:Lipoprotein n=1 Tax=Actinacidiphila acidipaludis TaxID=2873382 RepID=A0ABS7QDJ3_9ACTN|nr:hypothetical protein [Streptomyces acidipaludis]MBY8880759.1 hypothetical protein [Streptomyces acidipaludis]